MTAAQIYREAYRLLDHVTPLGKVDCGVLCNKSCCADHGREDAGMYLFPGEESIYIGKPDWLRIDASAFTYGDDAAHAPIAMCSGRCDRHLRPLSCRIFPLVPYLAKNARMTLIADPRAKSMCPLARAFGPDELDVRFTETVGYVMRVLCRFPAVRAFLEAQSELLDEYLLFWNK